MSKSHASLSRRTVIVGGFAVLGAGCAPKVSSNPEPEPPAPALSPKTAAEAQGHEFIVTVLGDSITAGLGLRSEEALPRQLENALRSAGVAARVRGAGVSGDTTAGGLARVDFSVQGDTDICVVALGGNDMLQGAPPQQVRENLGAIVRKLQDRGIGVVLVGMQAPARYGEYAAEFDRVFPELAKTYRTPLYPFLLEGVALRADLNQPDGIHPNAAGAKIIAEKLAPVVVAALRSRSGRQGPA